MYAHIVKIPKGSFEISIDRNNVNFNLEFNFEFNFADASKSTLNVTITDKNE